MRLIGNIIWLVLFGWISALLWVICGLLCCLTIILIPFGWQCFKVAGFSLWPFGREPEFSGGVMSVLANILWIAIFGLSIISTHVLVGLFLCLTIIGIPFGLQMFKIAWIGLIPFGSHGRRY